MDTKYSVSTSLSTLEKAADILSELGLGEMIGITSDAQFDAQNLVAGLTVGRKLREFVNIITSGQLKDADIELEEVAELIKVFFSNSIAKFTKLLGFANEKKAAEKA